MSFDSLTPPAEKLQHICDLSDRYRAGLSPADRDQLLQRAIFQGASLGQRMARTRSLCNLIQRLKTMEVQHGAV